MELSEEMRKHGKTEDFTSIRAVYEWADKVAHLEAVNAALLHALEISTTTLKAVYRNDNNNIAAKVCIERNLEAIAKAQEALL